MPGKSTPKQRTDRHGGHAPVGYDPTAYPRFFVTVDIVILTIVDDRLEVLLVRRRNEPHAGEWALPGGFVIGAGDGADGVGVDATLDVAAARELLEETGITAPARLEQLGAYGDAGRDARGNVVSIAYSAIVRRLPEPVAGGDAADSGLRPVDDVVEGRIRLAFDHGRIVADAVERVRSQLQSTDLATAFVDEPFTLTELRRVYETIWGEEIDAGNFRRSLIARGEVFVEPTGRHGGPGPEGGRPPELFRTVGPWPTSPVRRPRRPR